MAIVSYEHRDRIATVTMDDGKANALSPAMIDAVDTALDRADRDSAGAVVLAGRPGRFCAGFDLATLAAGGAEAEGMLRGGFRLAERLLSSDRPVVVACTGHTIAMGTFLACSGDFRVGAAGEFRIHANEVAIGLTMPRPALAILRYRLTPSAFDRAVGLAEPFTPEAAVAAGFLDRVVDAADVLATARQVAVGTLALDPQAHARSKQRARERMLDELRSAISSEFGSSS